MNDHPQASALHGPLRKLPKVQLHCHLEGSVRPQTFAELAFRYNIATEYRPRGEARHLTQERDSIYDFCGFQEFLFKFAAVCRSLGQPDDYVRILHEYAEDAESNGVMYAELLISPAVWRFFHRDLVVEGVCRRLHEAATEIERQRGLHIRFICDLTRNFGVENAAETVQLALKMRRYGMIAIGLGGDEANFPAALFEAPFKMAKTGGLHIVAHAGEAAGAQSVRDAVEILGAERIGHGIRALENSEVLDLLKERNVTLEVCPTSNFRTGVVPGSAVHPLIELDRAGVPLIIDSDDPAIFDTDITKELAYVAAIAGIEATLRFVRNAITASFADPPTKRAMAEKLSRVGAELRSARRT